MVNNDTCLHYHLLYKDPSSHWLTITIFLSIYTFIFIFGLIGNSAIIILTCKYRSLQTVQNIFIINLALADIILCCLSVPLSPISYIFKRWFFGSLLCRVVGGIQGIGMFISSLSLCAIAVDRYFRLVVFPGRDVSKRCAVYITWSFWLISIAMTFPYVYHMRIRTYKHKNICGEFCTEKWPSNYSKRIYTIVVFIFQGKS
jgi:neuropeptide Y receptor